VTRLSRELALRTGLSEAIVIQVIRTAPIRYKEFLIPKRNGGMRQVSQPSREVKALQRALGDYLLERLPVHGAATAYRPGKSIRHNAEAHANSGAIVKLDFKDFFPSIVSRDWKAYCVRAALVESEEEIEQTTSLLFRKTKENRRLHLAVGAPTSPMLSNILMFEFDKSIEALVSRDKVRYTRYADDLTFSGPRAGHLRNVLSDVQGLLKRMASPKLVLNHNKTVFATAKYKRQITGLVLANDGRVTIGDEKRRLVRARVHHAVLGRLDKQELRSLSGYLAFINSVEPTFLATLRHSYGAAIVDELLHLVPEEQGELFSRAAGQAGDF